MVIKFVKMVFIVSVCLMVSIFIVDVNMVGLVIFIKDDCVSVWVIFFIMYLVVHVGFQYFDLKEMVCGVVKWCGYWKVEFYKCMWL